jgi:hypothetical protein
MRGDVTYVTNLARTSRMRESHEAVEQTAGLPQPTLSEASPEE